MSSPLILSVSTVFALIGIVLVAIAFGTNNWSEYQVNRSAILSLVSRNATLRHDLNRVNQSDIFYDRTFGLFRECFPNQVPNGIGAYLSPLGSTCIDRDDYFPSSAQTAQYTKDQKTRMHLLRAMIAFYIIGLVFLFFCLFTGIAGCWKRGAGLILATGILLLFAVLFLAGAMAVWHAVDYYEREVIDVLPFEREWHPVLSAVTDINYGWSYVIAWIGVFFVLISSLLMLAAYRAMKEEESDEFDKKNAPYMMANYYDKSAMVNPYNYGTYPGYGAYPAASYYGGQYGAQNGYYGYLTYGR